MPYKTVFSYNPATGKAIVKDTVLTKDDVNRALSVLQKTFSTEKGHADAVIRHLKKLGYPLKIKSEFEGVPVEHVLPAQPIERKDIDWHDPGFHRAHIVGYVLSVAFSDHQKKPQVHMASYLLNCARTALTVVFDEGFSFRAYGGQTNVEKKLKEQIQLTDKFTFSHAEIIRAYRWLQERPDQEAVRDMVGVYLNRFKLKKES